jgi:acyl-ACP thioesterase
MARRRNTIRRRDDGTLIAVALVDWVFTRNGTTPVRVADALAAAFPAMTHPVVPVPLEERRPPADAARSPLRIRRSDADAMGHANNAVYLDLLDDAVVRAGGGEAVDAYPRTYDLQYSAAAPTGASLCDVAWVEENVWHYRLEAPDGGLLLHGRLSGGAQTA